MIGIYCIKNIINGKEYVGQSINIKKRIYEHKMKALKYPDDRSYNSILHQAIRKYGWDNFETFILEECDLNNIDEREKFYIKTRNTLAKNGYNIMAGGQDNRKNTERHFCSCGKTKNINAEYCLKCYTENRKYQKVTVDFDLISRCLDLSMEKVAKEIGYKSGNSLKKIIISQGYPGNREKMFRFFEKNTGEKHFKEKEKEEKQKQRKINSEKSKAKTVHQYSKDGKYIATFKSFAEAARATSGHSGPISEATRGKRKTAGGFIWKLEKI